MMKRTILVALALLPLLAACAQAGKPQTDRELKGMGMVVVYNLAADASEKAGVQALNDAGNVLFGPLLLNHQNGGESSSGGGNMSFPRWARVTWREGTDIRSDYKNGGWIGGKLTGDYTIEILSRIPVEVFNYAAAARGRAIVLRFRLKDNGVLLAWDVRESSLNGQGWVYKMHGGDFLDAKMYNGKLVDPGWEK
ncbi:MULTISPECIES: hypothetical protein [unclassified Undibacterium]|uniref:hypothetical protein n=1 Tax=unclassified Undibacterium TaxID=2630295 RepID=UPI003394179B